MKTWIFLGLAIFCATLWADITAPYTFPMYAGYEERAEARGYVVTYGDSAYGTAIGLSATPRFAGDSSFVGFILRANCPDNEPDSCYVARNPHRSYVNFRNRGFVIFTTNFTGQMAQCPCWFQTEYYVSNLRLHGHGPGKEDDWNSLLTISADTTDINDSAVVVDEDTTGYLYTFHTPLFGQGIHTFQRSAATDPTGVMRLTRNKWHLIQVYYDNHNTHSIAVWMDGYLESSANVTGRLQGVAQYHFGLYVAPACSTGTVLNDETMFTTIHDSTEGIFRFMNHPPIQ